MYAEPFIIERTIDHVFERRTPKNQLEKGQQDLCKHCRGGKHNLVHHAFPESANEWGSGSNRMAYQQAKKDWNDVFIEMIRSVGLPRPVRKISVEAELLFPRAKDVDEDNFRYPLSKNFADTLVRYGYIPGDNWDRTNSFWIFSFGTWTPRFPEPGESGLPKLTLIIFVED